MSGSCELCRAEHLTEWKYEDDICWVARCKHHPDEWLIVLKRHSPLPSPEEAEHVQELMQKLFPGKVFRGPNSLKEHWHWHME